MRRTPATERAARVARSLDAFAGLDECWRVRYAVGAALAAVVLWPTSAWAAAPVAGGRYVAHVGSQTGATLDLVLTVANDRRELVEPSWLEIDTSCFNGQVGLATDEDFRTRSVQVRRNGAFRRDRGYWRIAGRFVRRGRVAIGTVVWPSFDGCRGVRLRFRARPTGRPKATRPGATAVCDRTPIGDRDRERISAVYEVRERGAGCTTARELARRWHAEGACTALEAAACSIRGARCQRIRGGAFSPRALARCVPARAPAATIELVRLLPCEADTVELWVINIDCASARSAPVRTGGERCGRLGRRTQCRHIGDYTCSWREDEHEYGFFASGRCVLDRDAFVAFEFRWDSDS